MNFIEKYFYKTKYKVVFIRIQQGIPFIVKTVITDRIDYIYRIKGKTYSVNIENPSYFQRNYRIYLMNYDTGKQIALNEKDVPVSPEKLDSLVEDRIYRDMFSALISDVKQKFLWFIMGAIIGGLLLYTITASIFNGKIQDLMMEMNPIIPVFP